MARIEPLEPPFLPEVDEQFRQLILPGVPNLIPFRTLAKNLPMATAMGPWGFYELGRELSLPLRDREIVVVRTCARCGCGYERGVHVALFAGHVRFEAAQIASLTFGNAVHPCWTNEQERLLIRLVDALHDTGDVSDQLCDSLGSIFTEPKLLGLLVLVGWYHAISYVVRATRIPLEPGAPTFASVAPS